MTSLVCTIADVPRWFASQTPQRWFRARHTCSKVISGFFPPQPFGLLGDEAQDQQTQNQMSQQGHVAPPLEMPPADFRFADAEAVLHMPAAKGHPQELFQRRIRRGVGDEIFDLPR